MGYWENTTYLRHADSDEVVATLDTLFGEEGMRRVPAPPQRRRLTIEPMQYEGALQNDIWGIAILPGSPGWTVIKTAPLELLAERASNSDRMRLATICRTLGATALQLNVYDSSSAVLAEVSKKGVVHLSGYNGSSSDPMTWNNEHLDLHT